MTRKTPTNWTDHMAFQKACATRRAASDKRKAQRALSRDPAHRAEMEALLQSLLAGD